MPTEIAIAYDNPRHTAKTPVDLQTWIDAVEKFIGRDPANPNDDNSICCLLNCVIAQERRRSAAEFALKILVKDLKIFQKKEGFRGVPADEIVPNNARQQAWLYSFQMRMRRVEYAIRLQKAAQTRNGLGAQMTIAQAR